MSDSSLVARIAQALQARYWMLATAESCTGGLIAAACTAAPGSSVWFERGFVTYSNASKTELLGVDAGLIARLGAVSEAVACSMALGALNRSQAQLSIAVTGIAGPTGGTPDKPVGTVWLGWALKAGPDETPQCQARLLKLQGDRAAVREQTVQAALQQVLTLASA